MATKLPNTLKEPASSPKAQGPRAGKSAHLRGFSATKGGQHCPPHCPPPGPFPREPRPNPCASGGPLGPPLDIKDVARMIGCSPWTVRQTLIPRGLPHFRFKANGRLTFFGNQVIRWIENQQQGGLRQK